MAYSAYKGKKDPTEKKRSDVFHKFVVQADKLKRIKKVCDTMLQQLFKEGKFYPELADKNYHAFIKGFKMIDEIVEDNNEKK